MRRRDAPEPIDRAAVVALGVERIERGRWPTLAERPDLAGRDGVRTVGPPGEPSCVLMPADCAVVARVIADPQITAAWQHADADTDTQWAAILAAARHHHERRMTA